jgi:ATP-dependent Lhr-like helicase
MIVAKARGIGLPCESKRAVLEAFFGSFQSLRPAQQEAYSPILSGANVLICSGTGSGKTEAAIAPVIDRFYDDLAAGFGIIVLYICPTKALINDLRQRLEAKCLTLGVPIAIRHGDNSNEIQLGSASVLITTPESLDVILCRNDRLLSKVRTVIIDEAHLFYNNQRGLQLSILLNRLQLRIGSAVQIVAMSATVSDPVELIRFLFSGKVQAPFQMIRDESAKPLHPHLRILDRPQDLAPLIDALLRRPRKLLVFANSRRECDLLASVLRENIESRDAVYVHHSSVSAENREQVEREFSSRRSAVCIATSTLELGIDIGDIDAVLLYGAPPSYESFLQRIGRGSRRTDKTTLVCLVPPGKRQLLQALIHIAILDRLQSGALPAEPAFRLFGAALQQILSYLNERGGAFVRLNEFATIAGSEPGLEEPIINSILSHLASEGVLRRHGFKYSYGAGEGFHRLRALRLIYGNYPASARSVAVHEKGREIGRIHVANLLRLALGARFRFAGKSLEVVGMTRAVVEVRPAKSNGPLVDLCYPGSGPTTDPVLLHDARRFLHNGTWGNDLMTSKDSDWLQNRISILRPLVQNGNLPITMTSRGVAHLTFGGTLFNRAISLSAGGPIDVSDDLWAVSPRPINPNEILALPDYGVFFPQLVETIGSPTLFQALLPPELRVAELRELWLKTAVHADSLALLRTGNTQVMTLAQIEGLE